jgi:hypothetical protein
LHIGSFTTCWKIYLIHFTSPPERQLFLKQREYTPRLGHTDVNRNELAEHEEYQQINREVRFQEMEIIDPRQNFVMTLIRCATEQL